jgi:metallo-beta-lactamase family protein
VAQSISFFGAAQTVTGSRHLLELNGHKTLIDCGLFQGARETRQMNWQELPFRVAEIEAVVITHAHLDHIGWLPCLVKKGYKGPIYSTHATAALAKISLPDSGRIQEEDARQANKRGSSTHQPAMPLYTEEDAYRALKLFESLPYNTFHPLPGKAQWRYFPAGHILGSAFVELYFENGERILMSGDLGRYNTPIIKDPTAMGFAEYLVIESTYGNRIHSNEDPMARLEEIAKKAVETGGAIIVPSFAIGRTQELLVYISRLQEAGRWPRIPIFVDSPMAISSTKLYAAETDEHDEEMHEAFKANIRLLEPRGLEMVRDREQSKALNSQRGPLMIIAGSGMANGGRVQHHLLHRVADPSTIVLFTGYQAEGTLGRRLLERPSEVRILKAEVPVRATIEKLNSLSAHADQMEMVRWLSGFHSAPRTTFIVHGEPPAQAALRSKIEKDLGWNCVVPAYGERFDL